MPATKQKPQTKIDVMSASSLARLPWLVHGFSTRGSGQSKMYGGQALNLGFTSQDSRNAVQRNRQAFVSAVAGAPGQRNKRVGVRGSRPRALELVNLRQIHSDI